MYEFQWAVIFGESKLKSAASFEAVFFTFQGNATRYLAGFLSDHIGQDSLHEI